KLGIDRFLVIIQDLIGCPCALLSGTLHKALIVSRTVLTCKVNLALPDSLIATELCVLPNAPVGVTAQQVGIDPGTTECGSPVIVSFDAGPNLIELMQESVSIVLDLLYRTR